MRVRIKNNEKLFNSDANKIKTITSELPDYNNQRAFTLDNDEDNGIWLIEDFVENVDYPNLSME